MEDSDAKGLRKYRKGDRIQFELAKSLKFNHEESSSSSPGLLLPEGTSNSRLACEIGTTVVLEPGSVCG